MVRQWYHVIVVVLLSTTWHMAVTDVVSHSTRHCIAPTSHTSSSSTAENNHNSSSLEDQLDLKGRNASRAAAVYVKSSLHFSIDLLKLLYNGSDSAERNVFFSPHSIWSALTLAWLGAGGRTRSQMNSVMRLDEMRPVDTLRAFRYVQFWYGMRTAAAAVAAKEGSTELPPDDNQHNDELSHSDMIQHDTSATPSKRRLVKNHFNVASRVYFDNAEPVRPCMQDILQEEIRKLNFSGSSEKSRAHINSWVADRTADRIRDLVPSSAVDSTTRLLMVNAAYFKGTWRSKFDPENVKLELFYSSRDEITFVNMMTQKGQFNFGVSEELQAHILELPFNGEEISMFIILPPFVEGALDTTIKQLTPRVLRRMLGYMWTIDITVKVPKFKIQESYEISRTLVEMGMPDLFDGAAANLTGFSESAGLFLTSAVHKSFLQINEHGAEAAAATALISSRTSRPVHPSTFHCNHPFLYLIYDRALQNVLFMGTFEHPRSAKLQLDKKATALAG